MTLDSFAKCKLALERGLHKLNDFVLQLKKHEAKIRVRRRAACGAGARAPSSGGDLTLKKSGQIIDDLDNSFAKVLPGGVKQTLSTTKFKLKHVLDDVDFDQPLTLDRKRFLAKKRK